MKGPIDFVTSNNLERKLALASKFGYRSLAVFNQPIENMPFTALLITDRDGNLGPVLRKKRMETDFIAVASGVKSRLMKAAADDRVDAICPDLLQLWLDDSIAGMVRRKGSSVLFSFSSLLGSEGFGRVLLLRRLARALEIVETKDIPFTIASCADSEFEMRPQKELINLFSFIGGVDEKRAKMAVNDVPIGILKRNMDRRGHIAPGVRIVKK